MHLTSMYTDKTAMSQLKKREIKKTIILTIALYTKFIIAF